MVEIRKYLLLLEHRYTEMQPTRFSVEMIMDYLFQVMMELHGRELMLNLMVI